MGNQRKNMLIYLGVISVVIAGFFLLFDNGLNSEEIPMSSLIAITENPPVGQRVNITVKGDELEVKLGNENYTSRKEPGSSIYQILQEAKIDPANYEVEVEGSSGLGGIFSILLSFLPLILFGGILIFMMRQAQGGANNAMGFGKSKAKRFVGAKATVTFEDVAGVTEAKQELEEVVEFLKNPERFLALGARIPRGVLLVGPPGTGKTLLARAVAGEAGVPFFSISGSEFVEMFVGVGASRVRDLFDQAKKHSPCIVFVDEIDAVGRHRGAGLGGGHDEREQTLNQILVEMDGFDTSTNVIVLASTNRPDILDPALLRPGRFDRRVVLDNPDISGRKAILEVHSKGKPLEKEVELEKIAKQTPGFSGADLANLVNEAAILAARRGAKKIGLASLVESIDRVIAGPARKSKVITEEEREITAFHEAGHAVVAHNIPAADPVHKVSIISRGQMGGYTRYLPEKDRYLQTKAQFKAYIAAAMGGRVAEKLKFGEITTGASNDIQVATNMAKEMVTTYGMSEKLGLRSYGRKQETVFLGRDGTEQRDYSGKTEEVIDEEINLLLIEGEKEAEKILKKNSDQMEKLAKYLLDYETIDEEELMKLLAGEDVSPPLVGETLAHSGDEPSSKSKDSKIPPSDIEPQAN
ncbi:MAG: ATP-dependent zinc metalloprotease FtsH [Chloroflexota bacterium]|nr:ATP-dependent zinc metalloprotease FtsH [Chloroflexota bacterium]MEC9451192.1 ATP-dependent zinc metalloprotease FtsH [Chloroflexota bacterium]|tara:strand:+ start:12361 stop:14280 length:1920 start_codon:yes stop_codon:yes gene_type:complete